MIRFILQSSLEILFGLALITQVIIPILVPDLSFFWLFKKKDKDCEVKDTKPDNGKTTI